MHRFVEPNVNLLPWLPRSPDPSPIENVSNIMGGRLRTADASRSSARITDTLGYRSSGGKRPAARIDAVKTEGVCIP